MKRIALQMVAVIVALSVCLAPVAWAAEQNSNPNPAADLGLGLASFICSVPYGAIKVAVAILGGVIGGVSYVLSGFVKRLAEAVWCTTNEGGYTVYPPPLRGGEEFRFPCVPPAETPHARYDRG